MSAETAAVGYTLAAPTVAALYPSFAILHWAAPHTSQTQQQSNNNITSSSSPPSSPLDTNSTAYKWCYTVEWNCSALLEQQQPARHVTHNTHFVIPVLYPGATYFVRLLARGTAPHTTHSSVLTTAKCTFSTYVHSVTPPPEDVTTEECVEVVALPWLAPHALDGLCLPDALLCAMQGSELTVDDFPESNASLVSGTKERQRCSVLICEPRRFADGFYGCVTRVTYRDMPSCVLPGRIVYYIVALSYESARVPSRSTNIKKEKSNTTREEDVLSLLIEPTSTSTVPREGDTTIEEEEEDGTSCVVFCGVGERGTLTLAWAETCMTSALTVLGRIATQRRIFAITFGPARATLSQVVKYTNNTQSAHIVVIDPVVCQLSGNFLCYTAVSETLRRHGCEDTTGQLMQYAMPSEPSHKSTSSHKHTPEKDVVDDDGTIESTCKVYSDVCLGVQCGLCWDTTHNTWVMRAWPATMGPVTKAERTECLDATYHVQLLYSLAHTDNNNTPLAISGESIHDDEGEYCSLSPRLTEVQACIEDGWGLRVTVSGVHLNYDPQLSCLVHEACDFVFPLSLRHVSPTRLVGTASLLPALAALHETRDTDTTPEVSYYHASSFECVLTLQCMVQTSMGIAFHNIPTSPPHDAEEEDYNLANAGHTVTLRGDIAELVRCASAPSVELHHTNASLAGAPCPLLTTVLLLQPLLVCSQQHRATVLSDLVQSPRSAALRRTSDLLSELANTAELLRHKEERNEGDTSLSRTAWGVVSHITRFFTSTPTATSTAVSDAQPNVNAAEGDKAVNAVSQPHMSHSTTTTTSSKIGSASWTEAYYLERLLQELSVTEAPLPTLRGRLLLWRDRLLRGLPWLHSKIYRRHLHYVISLFPSNKEGGGDMPDDDDYCEDINESNTYTCSTTKCSASDVDDNTEENRPGRLSLLLLEMRLYEQVRRYLREECHLSELSHGASQEDSGFVALHECVSFTRFCDCLRPLFLFPTSTALRGFAQGPASATSPESCSTRAQLASLWSVCIVYALRVELITTHMTVVTGCPGAGSSTVASVCEGALHTVRTRHIHDPRRFWSRLVLLPLKASELPRVSDVVQLGLPLTLLLVGEASDMTSGALDTLWRTHIRPYYSLCERQRVHVLLCKADEQARHNTQWLTCASETESVMDCAARLCEEVRQGVCAALGAAHATRNAEYMPCPELALSLAPSLEALTSALRTHSAQMSGQALMTALVRQSRRALYVLLRQDLLPGTRTHCRGHVRTLTNATTTSTSDILGRMSAQARAEALQWQVLQSSSSAKTWLELAAAVDAIDYSANSDSEVARVNAVSTVYERALRALPLSFKLWLHYIRYRTERTAQLCRPHEWFQSIRELYVRALSQLPRMPLLWTAYLRFVMDFTVQVRITMVRHILLDALTALPATQHHLIWRLAKPWLRQTSVPHETMRALWTLYLCFDTSLPAQREYLHVLLERRDFAGFLAHCVRICKVSQTGDSMQSKVSSVQTQNIVVKEAGSLVSERVAQQLIEDLAFWELVIVALRTPGWTYNTTSSLTVSDETDTRDTDDSSSDDGLRVLAELGRRWSASATDFDLAYALFLCGQGDVVRSRALLRQLLDSVIGAERFTALYAVALEMEDRVVESCALNETLRAATPCERATIYAALFGSVSACDPLRPMRELVAGHALMLNQAQLREEPRNAWLWLKRIELAEERRLTYLSEKTHNTQLVNDNVISIDDMVALYRQAIAQCTAGLHTVDNAVGQLYECLAMTLIRAQRVQEALDVLQEAAWQVPFCSRAINIHLLGRYVELRVMTEKANEKEEVSGDVPEFARVVAKVAKELLTRLTSSSTTTGSTSTAGAKASPSGNNSSRRGHSLFVTQSAAFVASETQRRVWTAVGSDARAWLLVWDICSPYLNDSKALLDSSEIWLREYWCSPACTCETLCAVAWQLWRTNYNTSHNGEGALMRAQWLMERLFLRARTADPLIALFALSQYVSFLLCERDRVITQEESRDISGKGGSFSLYRLREVMSALRDIAPHTLPSAPIATIELAMALIALESRFGQRGIALREMQAIALLALDVLPCTRRHSSSRRNNEEEEGGGDEECVNERLLTGLLERTIDFTVECLGSEAVRPWCTALLRQLRSPRLIQRVALHWAAMEWRSNLPAQAQTVFEACAESQNPATKYGAVYWRLWESTCESVQSFARVAQRRQQVEVHFAKQRLARKRVRERLTGEDEEEGVAGPSAKPRAVKESKEKAEEVQ